MMTYIKSISKQIDTTQIEIPIRGKYIYYIMGNRIYLDDDTLLTDISEEEYIYIIQQLEKHYD